MMDSAPRWIDRLVLSLVAASIDTSGCDWWKSVPKSKVRLASLKEDGTQKYLFCPHDDDLKLDSPNRAEMVKIVQGCFQRGEPIIVRGCKGRMNWNPDVSRVCHS